MTISLYWKLTLTTGSIAAAAGVAHFLNPTVLSAMIVWMLLWMLGFVWLLAAETFDLSTRGFAFVFYCCLLGVGGKAFFDEKLWLADAVMQFMLILGGGLGAGLMADYIIKHDKPATGGQ